MNISNRIDYLFKGTSAVISSDVYITNIATGIAGRLEAGFGYVIPGGGQTDEKK